MVYRRSNIVRIVEQKRLLYTKCLISAYKPKSRRNGGFFLFVRGIIRNLNWICRGHPVCQAKIIDKMFGMIIYTFVGSEKHWICSFPNLYGPYVDTVGRNEKAIAQYIRNQLEEDYAADQISLKEYIDPFTGSKNK